MVQFNDDGDIRCEICGGYFPRVCNHVRKAHGVSAADYKRHLGLPLSKGLCSETSRIKTSEHSKRVYASGAVNNFIENSKQTRYPKGVSGRNVKSKLIQ